MKAKEGSKRRCKNLNRIPGIIYVLDQLRDDNPQDQQDKALDKIKESCSSSTLEKE